MSPKSSRSDRLADLSFSSGMVIVTAVLPEIECDASRARAIYTTPASVAQDESGLSSRDPDRRGVRIVAISCGPQDARENGLV